jgi:hypothetical protein
MKNAWLIGHEVLFSLIKCLLMGGCLIIGVVTKKIKYLELET